MRINDFPFKVNVYRPKKRPKKKGILKSTLFFVFYAFLAFLAVTACIFIYFAKDLPNPQKISQRQQIESTKIYDRTGKIILYDIHAEEKRTIISFDQISDYVKKATIITEDSNFYRHHGIDFKAIIRALLANIRKQKILQGGSTITQQFIKSSFLTPERTLTRKIKEVILALELEIKYSKDEILTFYLNQVPYGSNAYGIEAAAQTFFNKKAQDLTLAEAALLAALPKAPTYYSPSGSHPEELKKRQEYILDRMTQFSYITPEQNEQAKKEKLNFSDSKSSIKAPHFIMYIKEYLENKYGPDLIEKAGLKVQTTLDWDLQSIAEQIITEGVENNQKNFKAYNAALVAIDPKTGQILAMVGSKDYFGNPLPKGCMAGQTCKFDPNVNITIRERQPGSSFKPFAYAVAFKNGYTPDTILFDLKTEFNQNCPSSADQEKDSNGLDCYHPQNYDSKFRGPVTIRQALAQSLNLASVKVLYLAGVDATINLSQDMGITTLKERSRYGLSLVLGGGEVKLLDMTAAYAPFAAEGIQHPKNAILKIQDNQGKILEAYQDQSVKILEPQIARLISDILSDNQARTAIFGSTSPLYLEERPVAVKTGTTQEYRDAWTIGYTPSLVVGVWAGNNDNSPIIKAGAGLYAAAPIWNKFIKEAYKIKTAPLELEDEPSSAKATEVKENKFVLPKDIEFFNMPDAITTDKAVLNGLFENEKKVKIDRISNKLATVLTPPQLIEERIYKEVHSILYYVNKDNPQADAPTNPELDPQFWHWEKPILEWAKNFLFYNQPLPTEYDDIHTTANQPSIRIISPEKNSIIKTSILNIQIEPVAPLGIKQLDWFLDDDLLGTMHQVPYLFEIMLPPQIKNGAHSLKVKLYDNVLNSQENELLIFIDR